MRDGCKSKVFVLGPALSYSINTFCARFQGADIGQGVGCRLVVGMHFSLEICVQPLGYFKFMYNAKFESLCRLCVWNFMLSSVYNLDAPSSSHNISEGFSFSR
jgi:hypothetical protein